VKDILLHISSWLIGVRFLGHSDGDILGRFGALYLKKIKKILIMNKIDEPENDAEIVEESIVERDAPVSRGNFPLAEMILRTKHN